MFGNAVAIMQPQHNNANRIAFRGPKRSGTNLRDRRAE